MEAEVTLVLGLNTESERVMEVAREASRILRNYYGIWVYLVPVTLWDPATIHGFSEPWIMDNETMVPRAYVNGYPIPPSMLRTPEDMADHIVSLLRTHMEGEALYLNTGPQTPRIPAAAPVQ